MLVSFAIVASLLGRGYYGSFHSRSLTIKGRTSHRDREPIEYWFGMVIGVFAFLVASSAAVLMAFLLCMHLFRP
jgi:H+/Cl- antiporter ClcA